MLGFFLKKINFFYKIWEIVVYLYKKKSPKNWQIFFSGYNNYVCKVKFYYLI